MPGRGHRHNLAGCPVIVTENVEDYRDLIQEHVTPDDVVIELGCAQGVTTQLLAQRAKEVVGIDKSEFNSKVAQARYPNLSIYNMDAFDLSSILKLNKPFTKVFIDVSGNRPVGDVVELIEKYEKVFDPQLIVVKCFPMVKLILRSKVYRKVRPDNAGAATAGSKAAEAAAAGESSEEEDGEPHSGDEAVGGGDDQGKGSATATATTLEQSPSTADSPPCEGHNTS